MAVFFAVILLAIVLCWITGFLITTDFSVPNISLEKYHKILLIFPHPDDEVLGTGGFIQHARKKGADVIVSILTKGENGTPNAQTDITLKKVRAQEAKVVAQFLGVTKLIQEDFGDGKLNEKRTELRHYISGLINIEKPDLVITYDESGLYGHADHIVVSEIVTDLVQKKHKSTELWYTTFPKRILTMVHLPEHMAKDPAFKEKRKLPTIKLFIGTNIFKKIRSVYLYKSQYQSFRSSIPYKIVPLWFFYSMSWYEYFYDGE